MDDDSFLTLEVSEHNPSEYMNIIKEYIYTGDKTLNAPLYFNKTSSPRTKWEADMNLEITKELFAQLLYWYAKKLLDNFEIKISENDTLGVGSYYFNTEDLKEIEDVKELPNGNFEIIKKERITTLWCPKCNGLLSDPYDDYSDIEPGPDQSLAVCLQCGNEYKLSITNRLD